MDFKFMHTKALPVKLKILTIKWSGWSEGIFLRGMESDIHVVAVLIHIRFQVKFVLWTCCIRTRRG